MRVQKEFFERTPEILKSVRELCREFLEAADNPAQQKRRLEDLTRKIGFVKTSMTAGLKPPPFAGEPEQVARQVLARIDRPRPVVYTPRMWALVMLVIRLLPRFVMRKINF